MTDRERLYGWIRQRTGQDGGRYAFPGIDRGRESYFEEAGAQPALEEYDIRDRGSMERYLDAHLDGDLSDIRVECVRAFLKRLAHVEEEEKPVEGQRRQLPEFIYRF